MSLAMISKNVDRLPRSARTRVYRAFFAYLFCRINAATLNKRLSFLPRAIKQDIIDQKIEFFDKSTYTTRLHRAVVEYRDTGNLLSIASRYQVPAKDIKLVEFYVPLGKIGRIFDRPQWDLNEHLHHLQRHAKKIVHKARFSWMYDQSHDAEDALQEVLTEGIRVWKLYSNREHLTLLFLLNKVRLSMSNHIRRSIDYYTAKKRGRLRSSSDPRREFEAPVVSLSAIPDRVECSVAPVRVPPKVLQKALRPSNGPKVRQCVRALMGMVPAFDRWLVLTKHRSPDSIPLPTLTRFAAEWSGIRIKDVRAKLRPLYHDVFGIRNDEDRLCVML